MDVPPSRFERSVLDSINSGFGDTPLTAGLWLLGWAALAIMVVGLLVSLQLDDVHLATRGGYASARVVSTSEYKGDVSLYLVYVSGPVGRHVTTDRFARRPAVGDVIRVRYDTKNPGVAIGAGLSPWEPGLAVTASAFATFLLLVAVAHGLRFRRRLRERRLRHSQNKQVLGQMP